MIPVTDARPFLQGDGQQVLAWWDGGPALMLASALAVRVNFRGVFPIHTALRADLAQQRWVSAPCNESARALCSSALGAVFPADAPRVSHTPALLTDGWRGLGCGRSDGKVLVRPLVYDLSACDVLDEGVDVLFSRGTVHFRPNGLPAWEYVLFVALCVVLVRCLSFNVQTLLRRSAPVEDQWVGLGATAAVLALACERWDSPYVTEQDRLFFWASAAFVALYLALYTGELVWRANGPDRAAPFFNMLVGGLQLACLRFYRTADTPYALVLVGMLGARLWMKLRASQAPGRWACTAHASLLLDSLYLSFYTWVVHRAHTLTLIPVFAAGFVLSELVVL